MAKSQENHFISTSVPVRNVCLAKYYSNVSSLLGSDFSLLLNEHIFHDHNASTVSKKPFRNKSTTFSKIVHQMVISVSNKSLIFCSTVF